MVRLPLRGGHEIAVIRPADKPINLAHANGRLGVHLAVCQVDSSAITLRTMKEWRVTGDDLMETISQHRPALTRHFLPWFNGTPVVQYIQYYADAEDRLIFEFLLSPVID